MQATIFKWAINGGYHDFLQEMFRLEIVKEVTENDLDYAKEIGKWKIYKLLLSKKGGKMDSQRLEKEKERISRSQAIELSFREAISSKISKKKARKKFMEQLTSIICHLIREKLPLSDDILLSLWNYNNMEEKGSKKENKNNPKKEIWDILQKTLSQILTVPMDMKDVKWLETYILKSRVRPLFSNYDARNLNFSPHLTLLCIRYGR